MDLRERALTHPSYLAIKEMEKRYGTKLVTLEEFMKGLEVIDQTSCTPEEGRLREIRPE